MAQRTYVVTGAASGIGAATTALLKERGAKVIGIDLHNTDINTDLSTPGGRINAVERSIELSQGIIDGVIACAGIVQGIPQAVSINFFGVAEFVRGLLPTLKTSTAPRVAITSSMASLLPNSPELVDAMLAGDEAGALEIAQSLVD